MKKNILKLLALSLLLTGCNNAPAQDETLYRGPVDESGRLCINAFESKDDLRLIRQIIAETNRDSRLDIDISHDARYVKYGKGSLHVQYIAGIHGDLFQRINMTPGLEDQDFSDLKEVSCYIYNDNDTSKKASISIYKEDHAVLFTQSIFLDPHKWTECKLELNKIVVERSFDKFQGFAISLPNNSKGIPDSYYIDQFSIDFGVQMSETDIYYQGIVNNLMTRIAALPKTLQLNDTSTINEIKDIVDVYSSIPIIYRPIVSNYNVLEDLMKKYVVLKGLDDKTKPNAKALYFDTCFGLVQAHEDYTTSELSFSYSKEMHVPNEEGSLAVTFSEMAVQSNWNSFNIVPSYDWSKYSTITFSVYADTLTDIGFCITWAKFPVGDAGLQIQTTGKWVSYTYPAANFASSGEQINITGLDTSGKTVPLSGIVYFSAFMSRTPTADYFMEMLEQLPSLQSLTFEDAEAIEEVRNYYNSLPQTEKNKVSSTSLGLLESYEDKIKQLKEQDYLIRLPELIDRIPVKESYAEQEFSIIYEAYDAYNALSTLTQNSFDETRKKKLLAAYQKFNDKYPDRGIVLLPTTKNIEGVVSWSTSIGNLNIGVDPDYGLVYNFDKVNDSDDPGVNGALEVKFTGLQLEGYSQIRFWFKTSKLCSRFWVSETDWGNDPIYREPNSPNLDIEAGVWTEVTIDTNKIHGDSIHFINVLNNLEATITVTAIEGIK